MKLYIFDADGTLCDRETGALLPNVAERIAALPADAQCAIVTNQGGVGLRHWMESGGFGEPEKLPTEEHARSQYARVAANAFGEREYSVHMCFAYQAKSSGNWAPAPEGREKDSEWSQGWRKPAPGMLINAAVAHGAYAANTVMIGDSDADRLAAVAAGIPFMHADEFFNREKVDA